MSKQKIVFYILFALAATALGSAYIYFVPADLQPVANEENHYRKEREELIKRAEAGDPNSQYMISKIYRYGDNWTQKDNAQCFIWTKKAAESGVVLAQRALATMYDFGICTVVNQKEMIPWYQKAAAANEPYALNNLGLHYRNGGAVEKNLPLSFELFQRGAKENNQDAKVNLAYAYEKGIGTEKNLDLARFWYQKAKEQEPSLKYEDAIARTYFYASSPNYTEGMKWLEIGMSKKDPNAFQELGNLYKNGLGVPKDFAKAGEFYKAGADNGGESLKEYLHQTERDCLTYKAYLAGCLMTHWSKNPEVAFKLATIYRAQKIGTEANKWLLRAADKGSKRAQLMMAVDHANGNGVPQNNIEAYAWYKLASSGYNVDPIVKSYEKVFNSIFSRMNRNDQIEATNLSNQKILESVKW